MQYTHSIWGKNDQRSMLMSSLLFSYINSVYLKRTCDMLQQNQLKIRIKTVKNYYHSDTIFCQKISSILSFPFLLSVGLNNLVLFHVVVLYACIFFPLPPYTFISPSSTSYHEQIHILYQIAHHSSAPPITIRKILLQYCTNIFKLYCSHSLKVLGTSHNS